MTRKNEQLCFAEAPQRFSIMEKMDAMDEPDHNERRWLCVVVLGIIDQVRCGVFIGYRSNVWQIFGQINRLQFLPLTPMARGLHLR